MFDQNLTALNFIFAEWTSSKTLALRRQNLRSGGGLNGSFILSTVSTGQVVRTVFDDGAADQLFDGTAMSWFFLHKPIDTINNNGALRADDIVSVMT